MRALESVVYLHLYVNRNLNVIRGIEKLYSFIYSLSEEKYHLNK
jgi:hypothetical protein